MLNKCESYKKAQEYWATIPATVDGVLGGFGFISQIDIDGSRLFLEALISEGVAPSTSLALDCGAGIGRVSKCLLMPYFEKVDLVEPDKKFIDAAKLYIGIDDEKLGTMYMVGLQDFFPEKKYDIIWNQWVLGHLNDEDLISFFLRCRSALTESGVIIVKENVTSSNETEFDETDSSVTRPLYKLLDIFEKAKLKRIKQCKQTNFPNGIYPVHMFALKPMILEKQE